MYSKARSNTLSPRLLTMGKALFSRSQTSAAYGRLSHSFEEELAGSSANQKSPGSSGWGPYSLRGFVLLEEEKYAFFFPFLSFFLCCTFTQRYLAISNLFFIPPPRPPPKVIFSFHHMVYSLHGRSSFSHFQLNGLRAWSGVGGFFPRLFGS